MRRKPLENVSILALVSAIILFFAPGLPGPLSAMTQSWAKSAEKPSSLESPGHAASKPVPVKKSVRLVRDDWYTVTVGGKVHYGYYEERVEIRNGDQVYLRNQFWKMEENYLNKEDLGVAAKNNRNLSPLFFNYHSLYRTTETSIDATVTNKHFMSVRIKQGSDERPILKRTIPASAFFSSFFPVWLGHRLPTLKEGATLSFETIMEDNIRLQFAPMEGELKLEKPDAYAKSKGLKKIRVDSRGIRSWWWVNASGTAEKIEMPEQNIVVRHVSPKAAKKFLE